MMYAIVCILVGIVAIFYLFAVALGVLAVVGGIVDVVKGKRHARR